jgi:hypothetical protein
MLKLRLNIKIEEVCSSQTLVTNYQTTRRHIPEYSSEYSTTREPKICGLKNVIPYYMINTLRKAHFLHVKC